ncbi:hypothetical protein GOP93_17050 [Vibrio cholerae]|nr:BLUF domain-containing protein [Vibrio paracholerae]MEB5598672.1 hypothetical protein [Vibrio cholerae]KFD79136.1 sensors of blue-light using FAD family protein [Vibrio paracholerae]ORP21524.1 hypothetical protein B7953_10655 [Vibrio paracholerae]RBM47097.1 hypothetical protein DLR66_02775 [Vibrio paracholerae]TXZ31967.1 BLUF domain-containing protein [Vibrio cholerae]
MISIIYSLKLFKETLVRISQVFSITQIVTSFNVLRAKKKDVEEVFALIEKDKRHTNIMIIEKAPIATRQFGEWAMAYILQSPLLIPIHQRLMHSNEFDPRLITPDNANLLLEELKNHLPKAYLATLQKLS